MLVEHHDDNDDNDRVFTLYSVTEDVYNELKTALAEEKDATEALAETVSNSDRVARLQKDPAPTADAPAAPAADAPAADAPAAAPAPAADAPAAAPAAAPAPAADAPAAAPDAPAPQGN